MNDLDVKEESDWKTGVARTERRGGCSIFVPSSRSPSKPAMAMSEAYATRECRTVNENFFFTPEATLLLWQGRRRLVYSTDTPKAHTPELANGHQLHA